MAAVPSDMTGNKKNFDAKAPGVENSYDSKNQEQDIISAIKSLPDYLETSIKNGLQLIEALAIPQLAESAVKTLTSYFLSLNSAKILLMTTALEFKVSIDLEKELVMKRRKIFDLLVPLNNVNEANAKFNAKYIAELKTKIQETQEQIYRILEEYVEDENARLLQKEKYRPLEELRLKLQDFVYQLEFWTPTFNPLTNVVTPLITGIQALKTIHQHEVQGPVRQSPSSASTSITSSIILSGSNPHLPSKAITFTTSGFGATSSSLIPGYVVARGSSEKSSEGPR